MFKLKVKKFILSALAVLLIVWGAASFFIFPTLVVFQWIFAALSVVALAGVIFSRFNYFRFVVVCLTNTYAVYGVLFTYSLPLWVVMIILAIVLGFSYYHSILSNREGINLINLNFYVLFVLEIFLALSYFLINPLTRSAILVVFSHFFVGYSNAIKEDNHFDKANFMSYFYLTLAMVALIFLTSSWGH